MLRGFAYGIAAKILGLFGFVMFVLGFLAPGNNQAPAPFFIAAVVVWIVAAYLQYVSGHTVRVSNPSGTKNRP